MNPTPESPSSTAPAPKPSWLRRLFSRRVLGRLLAGFLVFVTLLMLFYVEEKVRGRSAWERYKQELARQGISVDIKTILPPALPPEQNFARAPLLQPMYEVVSQQKRPDTPELKKAEEPFSRLQEYWEQLGYQFPPGMPANWRTGRWPDFLKSLAPSRQKYPPKPSVPVESPDKAAELILEGLRQTLGPMLDELQADARTRPYSNFDIPYDRDDPFSILLFHLAKFKTLGVQSATRATAELYLKQSDAAFRDTLFALHLSETLKDDPLLIAFLVEVALREIAINAVWYGLATHQWNASQLEQMQGRLEGINMMTQCQRALNGERVLMQRGIEGFARRFPRKVLFSDLCESDPDQPAPNKNKDLEYCLSHLYPKGWFYFESINYQRLFLAHIQFQTNQTRLDLQASEEAFQQLEWEIGGSDIRRLFHHRIFAGLMLPGLGKVIHKAANSQMASTMAATACALERYRLAHGAYPSRLDELTPKFLKQVPLDLISGQPLKYQLNADGTFKLYSFGRNGVDDGGTVVFTDSGSINQNEGDWVWQYPAR